MDFGLPVRKASKPLSDTIVADLKPGLNPRKVPDASAPGLHLLISPTGIKSWRFRYQRDRREFVITLGKFEPKAGALHMTTTKARAEAYKLKAQLQAGAHPAEEMKQAKLPDKITFKFAADEYLKAYLLGFGTGRKRKPAASTQANARRSLGYCRSLHKRAIAGITPGEYQAVIMDLAKQEKFESAVKCRRFISKVCQYAFSMHWIARNPIPDLLPPPNPQSEGFAAIVEPVEFGKLLRTIQAYDGNQVVRLALLILAYTFVRPGELRLATWKEIDFKSATWTIPAARMKTRKPHKVMLSRQALALFKQREQDAFLPLPSHFCFPSTTHNGRPLSENTLNFAMRSMGIDTRLTHTAHGFRKSASTMLNEAGEDRDLIEISLSHGDEDRVRAVYNKAEYLPARRELMQTWADMVDRMRTGKGKP